jgi:hypothetical protein
MRLLRLLQHKEQGQLLILSVFIILVFASLSIVPILTFMGTGVNTAKNTGLHTQEIYAAEAGVYDSMWKIIMIEPGVPKGIWDPPLQYSISGGVNGKDVDVTLSRYNSLAFQIHSVATDPNTNHQSTVESDVAVIGVSGLDLAEFTKYAVTSNGTITSQYNNVKIDGNVWIPDLANYQATPPNGDLVVAPITGWPTPSDLDTYYSFLVNKSNPYSNGIINISNPTLTGPLYAHGVSNGNYTLTGTGTLTGALYIDGNLFMDQYAHVNLDGNTIFATGSISTQPQSYVAGPGAIIAVGDISFSPHCGPSYLLVMSVSGFTNFQPSSAFVGAVCGNTEITMKPNCSVTWTDPGIGNLDLPGIYNHIQAIKTWAIK